MGDTGVYRDHHDGNFFALTGALVRWPRGAEAEDSPHVPLGRPPQPAALSTVPAATADAPRPSTLTDSILHLAPAGPKIAATAVDHYVRTWTSWTAGCVVNVADPCAHRFLRGAHRQAISGRGATPVA